VTSVTTFCSIIKYIFFYILFFFPYTRG